MAKWLLTDNGQTTTFKSPREMADYLRTMDETELIEDEVILEITVVDD